MDKTGDILKLLQIFLGVKMLLWICKKMRVEIFGVSKGEM